MNENRRPTQALIADGEGKLCWRLRGILEDEGFGVTVAATEMTALKAALDKSCKVVFIGTGLPGANPATLARLIRHLMPQTRCILISRDSRRDSRIAGDGFRQGVISAVISRDLRVDEILGALHAVAAHR